jgi:hypothetical protein
VGCIGAGGRVPGHGASARIFIIHTFQILKRVFSLKGVI